MKVNLIKIILASCCFAATLTAGPSDALQQFARAINQMPKARYVEIWQTTPTGNYKMFISFDRNEYAVELIDPKTNKILNIKGKKGTWAWQFVPANMPEQGPGYLEIADTASTELSKEAKILITLTKPDIIYQALKAGLPFDDNSFIVTEGQMFSGTINGIPSNGRFVINELTGQPLKAVFTKKFNGADFDLQVVYKKFDNERGLPIEFTVQTMPNGELWTYAMTPNSAPRQFHHLDEIINIKGLTIFDFRKSKTIVLDVGLTGPERPPSNNATTQKKVTIGLMLMGLLLMPFMIRKWSMNKN